MNSELLDLNLQQFYVIALMRRVLVTGASGMLGATLVKEWRDEFEIYATDRRNFVGSLSSRFRAFDLSRPDYDELFDWARPEIVIHCAAITNVDYCQDHPEEAMTVNGYSVEKVLHCAPDVRMIFISSDAVFSEGTNMATERDKAKPENIYGESKQLGERLLADCGPLHNVVRTTIVGRNLNSRKRGFVDWLVGSVRHRKQITLFDDVQFTPITIWHFADELRWLIENSAPQVIHVSGDAVLSKYEFGKAVCANLDLDTTRIVRGSIDDYPFHSKRRKNQTLSSELYKSISGRRLPTRADTIDLLTKKFLENSHERY